MYQIFVVEDELLIRQSVREMVEHMGGPYTVCGEASDGEMALSMMQELMPDILLTDIKMPFLDGLELSRHAKAMLPGLKIIIISGYDEFESAQKAISLGVDLYLVKPLRSADLTEAIRKMAERLEQSRSEGFLPSAYKEDEVHQALYQHFMQQLFFGGKDTGWLLEKASTLNFDLVWPFYQVVLFQFDSANNMNWRQRLNEMLRNNPSALHYWSGADSLALLVCAKTKTALSETAYRMINLIRHEQKEGDAVITTLAGNIVERVSAIKSAYYTADDMLKKVQAVSAGQIVDINDTAQITADIVSFDSSFGRNFAQRLLHATIEDVPDILEEFLRGTDGNRFNSALYCYYTLVDILKTAVQVVSAVRPEIDKQDIASQFSSTYDIFAASARRDTFEKQALELLLQTVRLKQENLTFARHGHVVTQAEKYILENFCDPNISLITVANHVGMSPAHFSTVFSQTVGKTLIAHLTFLRIERAKELLTQTNMKLATIATEIGYNEPNYFSHVFKKLEGLSPKEYRSLHSTL